MICFFIIYFYVIHTDVLHALLPGFSYLVCSKLLFSQNWSISHQWDGVQKMPRKHKKEWTILVLTALLVSALSRVERSEMWITCNRHLIHEVNHMSFYVIQKHISDHVNYNSFLFLKKTVAYLSPFSPAWFHYRTITLLSVKEVCLSRTLCVALLIYKTRLSLIYHDLHSLKTICTAPQSKSIFVKQYY